MLISMLLQISLVLISSLTVADKKKNRVNLTTLRFVHAIWRHGARTPIYTFESDPNTWPNGLGQLTKIGINQHYELGKYLKSRYSGFLSETYDANQINVTSTNSERTIMSASANLAGMYPSNRSELLSPIPVHIASWDLRLFMAEYCPIPDKLEEEIFQSDSFKSLEKQNQLFLKFLTAEAKLRTPLKLRNLDYVYDPLIWEYFDNRTFPSWVNQSVFDEVIRLRNLITKFYYSTFKLQRLRGGMLFGNIYDRMEVSKNGELGGLIYYAYSAHDTTLVALLQNFGIAEEVWPPFACVILVELHEQHGDYFVKVYKRNGTTENDFHTLTLLNCNPCSLEKFGKLAKNHTPLDWEKECTLESDISSPTTSGSDEKGNNYNKTQPTNGSNEKTFSVSPPYFWIMGFKLWLILYLE